MKKSKIILNWLLIGWLLLISEDVLALSLNINPEGRLTQYPASVRTSIIRMIINEVPLEKIAFNSPNEFALLGNVKTGVFHPQGGNHQYSNDFNFPLFVEDESLTQWYFNARMEIPGIRSKNIYLSGKSVHGNDLIAFLPAIKQEICLKFRGCTT